MSASDNQGVEDPFEKEHEEMLRTKEELMTNIEKIEREEKHLHGEISLLRQKEIDRHERAG